MPADPPWLRFQAYVVGLPKTGSTSVAAVFAGYRSAHERDLHLLLEAGLDRRCGRYDDAGFLRATGIRLVPPVLEMDSTTSHHLYADVLRDRFPAAVLVHTIRDVGSWITSVLDMVLRKRVARRMVNLTYTPVQFRYLAALTEGTYDLEADPTQDDRTSLAPLMRYWAAHLRDLRAILPPARSLVVRTEDIAHRLPDLASAVGVPADTLRPQLAHANRSPLTLDRCAIFDGEDVRAAYRDSCADLMAEAFPDEHEAWLSRLRRPVTTTASDRRRAWEAHVAQVDEWVADAVARHGAQVAR